MNDDIQVLDTGQDTDTSTYTPYEVIGFENGTLVTPASADLETGAVTMPVYSGKAPINATNLNHLEQGLKDLETHVLDLPDVENSLASDSTTNAPSIHAVKQELEQLEELINKIGTRVQIFNGTGNVNTALTINTTWETLDKFKNLIVELNYTTNNNHTTVTFPFELLSGGTNLANSARTTNVYMPIVSIVDRSFGYIHLVPSEYITTNSIKFDMFDESIKITRMWVEY